MSRADPTEFNISRAGRKRVEIESYLGVESCFRDCWRAGQGSTVQPLLIRSDCSRHPGHGADCVVGLTSSRWNQRYPLS